MCLECVRCVLECVYVLYMCVVCVFVFVCVLCGVCVFVFVCVLCGVCVCGKYGEKQCDVRALVCVVGGRRKFPIHHLRCVEHTM